VLFGYDGVRWEMLNVLTGSEISDGTITTTQLASNAVTGVKIAANAVTSDKIADATIVRADLAAGAAQDSYWGVCSTAADTYDKTVTVDSKFSLVAGAMVVVRFSYTNTAASAPTLNVNGTGAKPITNARGVAVYSFPKAGTRAIFLYDGTNWVIVNLLTGNEIDDGAVTATQLASNAVTETKLASNAVTGAKIAARAITGAKIAAGTITTDLLAAGKPCVVAMQSFTASSLAAGATMSVTINNPPSVSWGWIAVVLGSSTLIAGVSGTSGTTLTLTVRNVATSAVSGTFTAACLGLV
jgi:hypothetical protein